VFLHLGLAAGHHHPDIWHAGDNQLQDNKTIDWGVFQLMAVGYRPDADNNLFLSSISFGNHALHHLFPAIDLALLPQLTPIFEKTCTDFGISHLSSSAEPKEHREWAARRHFSLFEAWKGMFMQVINTKPCY
jgi:fatty acid desaturase